MYKIISANDIQELEKLINKAACQDYRVAGEIIHIKDLDRGGFKQPKHYSGLIILMTNDNK